MGRKRLASARRLLIVAGALAVSLPAVHSGSQTPRPAKKARSGAAADSNSPVAQSRKSILATGVSERYFDRHFKLVQLVDKPADMRVVWRYSVNGYTTTVT